MIIQIMLLMISSFTFILAMDEDSEIDITSYCPGKNEINSWQPDGEPEIVIGEDLYLMINGGAEIYFEYGFNQAIFASYINQQGSRINLEIYEMENGASAYGIYTFKTGKNGAPINVGYMGWLESYFLNFCKGKFLVTIIGLDAETDLISDIMNIAKSIDAKLNFSTEIPPVISYLPKENLLPNGITYLKGNQALYNQYPFDSRDIFGVKEGVIGKYKDCSIFIFQYQNVDDSKKWYDISKKILKQSNCYRNFRDENAYFKFQDSLDNNITIKQYHNWILIILRKTHLKGNHIFSSLEKKLMP